jgi:hypothetical protein
MHDMSPVKAHVRNGHYVSDEPAELPEGTPVNFPIMNVVDAFADMDPEERAELEAELEVAYAEADAGELIDADEVLAKLRAQA